MYTAREVSAVLGVSTARLRSYVRAGFIAPARGDKGEMRFTFQHLLLLRKAEGLVTDRIPPRRVHEALRKLVATLPEGTPLGRMELAAEGGHVVVDDGQTRWQPMSGQVVFDFQGNGASEGDGATVTALVTVRAAVFGTGKTGEEKLSTQEIYERACAVEDGSPKEAVELYRAALAQDPQFADAHVNLGRLLHEAGEIHAALVHYRAALAIRPTDATGHFNVGVALEDLGTIEDAIGAYEKAIEHDPQSADAHYNVARLLERSGRPEQAIRHLLVYRQLTRKPGR